MEHQMMEAPTLLPEMKTNICEFSDEEVRNAFEFASAWAWFQQPGKSIFADRLYVEANRADIDADLAEAVMKFLHTHGFIVPVARLKWVVRKPFAHAFVDAACTVVSREKLAA